MGRNKVKAWLRSRIFVMFIVLNCAVPTLLFQPSASAQELFSVDAILTPPAPASVSVGTPISASVDFGVDFSSIERICFIFYFQEHLLDPGEHLDYGFGTPPRGLFGFTNVGTESQSDRTSCLLAQHEIFPLFLDGEEDFSIEMTVGSVIIRRLEVQITGIFGISVNIDIKPGNKHNNFNPLSGGRVWVAILSDITPESPFDPLSQVDISTVEFGSDAATAIRHKARDVNGDGLNDLLLQFKVRETGIACGETEAILTGDTFDGQQFSDADSVNTVRCE